MPINVQEKQYLPLKSVILGKTKDGISNEEARERKKTSVHFRQKNYQLLANLPYEKA